jgi:hypothetical protein
MADDSIHSLQVGGPSEGDPAERWYLPTWGERARLMGWRLIYFVPLLLMLPLVVFAPFSVLLWWKVVVIFVALPLGAAMNTAKHAIRLRKDPFCIHCGYALTGLAEGHRCPECGVSFTLAEIEDYRRDPHWFIQRQKIGRQLPPADRVFAAGPVRSKRRRDGT